jgi:hypothetical protein
MDHGIQYFAGLFDGEGSVSVGRSDRSHVLFVGISNCSRRVLVAARNFFGVGEVYKRNPSKLARKPQYVWHVGSRQAAEVLRRLAPHLIVKRQPALMGLKLQERIARVRCTGGSRRLSEREILTREKIKVRIQQLNLRGGL